MLVNFYGRVWDFIMKELFIEAIIKLIYPFA